MYQQYTRSNTCTNKMTLWLDKRCKRSIKNVFPNSASSKMETRWWGNCLPSLLQGHCEFITRPHTHTHTCMRPLSAPRPPPPVQAACSLSCPPPPLIKPPPTTPDAQFQMTFHGAGFWWVCALWGEQMMCITEDLVMTWTFQKERGWGDSFVSKTQPTFNLDTLLFTRAKDLQPTSFHVQIVRSAGRSTRSCDSQSGTRCSLWLKGSLGGFKARFYGKQISS